MEDLQRYVGGDSSSTSVEQALLEATGILRQLQSRNFTAAQERADRELAETSALLQMVQGLFSNGTALNETQARLEGLRDRIEDSVRLIEQSARRDIAKVCAV